MGLLSKLFGSKKTAEPKQQPESEEKQPVKPMVTTDIDGRIITESKIDRSTLFYDFYIAGVKHHCTMHDIGLFAATIFNESDNSYNKKAMAVGHQQKSAIVGYVSEAILDDYRKWCKRATCPGIGYIYYDGTQLRGRVRSYLKECNIDDMLEDMQSYADTVCEHFGWQKMNIIQ